MLSWKTINVFVSSTFLDLQVERDYLSRYLVPCLNDSLKEKQIRINLIDLRSGVNTNDVTESEKEEKVLGVCIQEIHNSRPYFIGIVGGRYGWVPSEDLMKKASKYLYRKELQQLSSRLNGKSVTELEMLVGMLRDKEMLPHSFVCIKDKSSFERIPENLKTKYLEEERKSELTDLTNNIINDFKAVHLDSTNIIRYRGVWKKDKFIKLPGFIEGLTKALLDDILAENSTSQRPRNTYEEEFFRKEAFWGQLAEQFCGRRALIESEISFLNRSNAPVNSISVHGHCLTGFSGCGKSSIIAKLYQLIKKTSDEKLIVLSHCAGISYHSINFNNMIKDWNYQLSLKLKDDYRAEYKPINDFIMLSRRVKIFNYRIVILIDSLDSFIPDTLPSDFSFIPIDIPFVCTSLPIRAREIFGNSSKCEIINVDNFSRKDAGLMIRKKMGYKDIPEVKFLKDIKNSNGRYAFTSPLWLSMALTRILELDAYDYEILNKDFTQTSITEIVRSLPSDPKNLFLLLLDRCFMFFNKESFLPSIIIIALSYYGVTESDLSEILGKKWDILTFSRARNYLHDYISRNGLDNRMTLSHAIIKEALLNSAPEYVERIRNKYLKYLFKKNTDKIFDISNEYRNEVLMQILHSEDAKYLKKLYDLNPMITYSLYSVYREVPIKTIKLLTHYIDRYGVSAIPLIEAFIRRTEQMMPEDDAVTIVIKDDLLSLSKVLIKKVINWLSKGSSLVKKYTLPEWFSFYDYFKYPISFFKESNDTRGLMEVINQMKETYELIKNKPDKSYNEGNYDSFYTNWISTFGYFINSGSYSHDYRGYLRFFSSFVEHFSDYLINRAKDMCPFGDWDLYDEINSVLRESENQYRYETKEKDVLELYLLIQEKLYLVLSEYQEREFPYDCYESFVELAKQLIEQCDKRFKEVLTDRKLNIKLLNIIDSLTKTEQ